MVAVIAVTITIQLFSGNLIEPKLMGNSSDLHPSHRLGCINVLGDDVGSGRNVSCHADYGGNSDHAPANRADQTDRRIDGGTHAKQFVSSNGVSVHAAETLIHFQIT